MPIRRGGGVDQLDLIRFSRRLAAGWVSLSSSIMTRFKFKYSKVQIQNCFLLILSFATPHYIQVMVPHIPRGENW